MGYDVAAIIVPKATDVRFVKETIGNSNLVVITTDEPNTQEFLASLYEIQPDVLISAGYNKILKEKILAVPKLGAINLHAGRVPQYRGGSPMNWQIINGEKSAWISVLSLTTELDNGPVLAEAEIPIGEADDISSMHAKANAIFPKITLDALDRLKNKQVLREQNEKFARYFHQRSDYDGLINWDKMAAEEVFNLTRALASPYLGAYTFLDRRKLRIFSVSVHQFPLRGTPGRVGFISGIGPLVVCKIGCVLLKSFKYDDGIIPRLGNGYYFCSKD